MEIKKSIKMYKLESDVNDYVKDIFKELGLKKLVDYNEE